MAAAAAWRKYAAAWRKYAAAWRKYIVGCKLSP